MDQKNLINIFVREVQCEYKGRNYKVRDNGAICRLTKEGCRSGKLDNIWTFGTRNSDGYMIHTGNIRVHQVVCTAFNGPEPHPHMIVYHIDRDNSNNRPENLRWLTRIEYALMNDYTRKKIIKLCGSIESFIDDPSILGNQESSPDINWMKTVTKEQAAVCRKYIEEWRAKDYRHYNSNKGYRDAHSFKSKLKHKLEIVESWINSEEESLDLKNSLTPGAKQVCWKTPTEFPLVPQVKSHAPLQEYLNRMHKGSIYSRNCFGESSLYEVAMSDDKSHLSVVAEFSGATNYALSEITFTDGYYIHKSIRTFFTEKGAQKYFTLSLGKEWTGGDVFEDFC